MLKLIRLEWKKNNIFKYIRNSLICTVCLCLWMFFLTFVASEAEPEPVIEGITSITDVFCDLVYMIFAGCMLSSVMIKPFKDKTVNLMFTYPIKRHKILISQMLSVWIFIILAVAIAKIAVYYVVFFGQSGHRAAFILDFDIANPAFYYRILLSAVLISSISFVALFVGFMTKSTKAPVVTSVFLILITEGQFNGKPIANNLYANIVLVSISVVFAVVTIITAEKRDLIY